MSHSENSTARAAYIHVPFCRHRCGYCNFTLVAGHDDLIDDYLAALETELSWIAGSHPVDTLFFGGGTPTHLPKLQLHRLLEIVLTKFPLAPAGEFSIEANPLDLDPSKCALLAEHGVTRVSIGGQSFNDEKLKTLERDHLGNDVQRSIHLCDEFFSSLSLDLIFAAPGETLDSWNRDLSTALELPLDHISTYGLTFERGTTFFSRLHHGELTESDEELQRAMYLSAIDTLTAAGLEHYEVSNFAAAGHRCRHNETYWTGGAYFAAGPGAARHLEGRRETNHRSTLTYLQRVGCGESPIAESETLTPKESARERFVFAMRRIEGVSHADFKATTNYSLDDLFGDKLRSFTSQGLLIDDGKRIRLSRQGLLISDSIWPELL